MFKPDIRQFIDLDRYPLDQPGSAAYAQLLQDGRRALQQSALFSMTRFVRAEAIDTLAGQLKALLPVSVRYDQPRSAYVYGSDGVDLAADHPLRQAHRCSYHQVLNYQIANDSPLRQIYYYQPLTDFLRELCGFGSFYRSDCPHLALSSKIAGDGDTDGWHFDSNDVVFSLLLQLPEAGGEFEYAPFLRSKDDENYDGVRRVVADPEGCALRPPMGLGDFNVFMGDLSLHRVSPVVGERQRVVALFCYDRHPGQVFDQSYIEELQGYLPA
jgi:hypothetical protein